MELPHHKAELASEGHQQVKQCSHQGVTSPFLLEKMKL